MWSIREMNWSDTRKKDFEMFQTLLSFALGSSGEICNYQRSLTSDVCLFAQDNDCIIDINITFSLSYWFGKIPWVWSKYDYLFRMITIVQNMKSRLLILRKKDVSEQKHPNLNYYKPWVRDHSERYRFFRIDWLYTRILGISRTENYRSWFWFIVCDESLNQGQSKRFVWY